MPLCATPTPALQIAHEVGFKDIYPWVWSVMLGVALTLAERRGSFLGQGTPSGIEFWTKNGCSVGQRRSSEHLVWTHDGSTGAKYIPLTWVSGRFLGLCICWQQLLWEVTTCGSQSQVVEAGFPNRNRRCWSQSERREGGYPMVISYGQRWRLESLCLLQCLALCCRGRYVTHFL